MSLNWLSLIGLRDFVQLIFVVISTGDPFFAAPADEKPEELVSR